ncbi:hypothetical protein Acy02nite_62100 [Actinoplanes cyaneus]|uniref:Guanylate cyclase domain-containing protein n=1 Tax=Actinoplanes cyaneus TaxID=52696 RepID=A0A919MA92_9ACTN|nr:hypothetical protein [Actinoplanes cyaneus]MCW2141591.1 hypothetical protein [Actinoplanes cyaneus]GID68329.1 hypothetical protein Acy02nite_62100 [Actinoplanes cyaneus]
MDPFAQTVDLPPYRAILAVDAKDFTAQPSISHQPMSSTILDLVGDALARTGLQAEWSRPAFLGPTGDGFAVGLPPRVLPHLAYPFARLLQERLAEHNRTIRVGQPRIRLRVSVNVGPLPADPEDPHWTGNGTVRNDTHRLLDSKPVKAILAAASEQVTHAAFIFSDRVYQDVVVAGYSELHPDRCIEVPATVDGKNFAQRAWLYVPEISGNLLGTASLAPDPDPDPVTEPTAEGHPTASVEGPQVRRNWGQVATTVETMTQNPGSTR